MKELKIAAIKDGTVIDHIPSEKTFRVAKMLNIDEIEGVVSVASGLKSRKVGRKGIIKISNRELNEKEVNKISLLAPNASLNIVKNFEVVEKIRVALPDEIVGIGRCANPKCVTNNEKVKPRFKVIKGKEIMVRCHYCERVQGINDIFPE